MARYLYGAVLTGVAVASNNRGENSGNMAMLQHVFWGATTTRPSRPRRSGSQSDCGRRSRTSAR
jgi:hypothetical protein